jgi:filamin
MTSFPVVSGEGLHHAFECKPAQFLIDTQGMRGGLEITVEGPNHYTKNHVTKQPDGGYLITYTPVECGQYKVFVKWNQRDVPHSPYTVAVVNPSRVKVVGGTTNILDRHGILSLKPLEERTVSFDTSECGPGKLTALIDAPNGTKLPLKLALNNSTKIYDLTFVAIHEGEYTINVALDGVLIDNMPLRARTERTTAQMDRIEVRGAGLAEAKVGVEQEFVIDGGRAGTLLVGSPDVRMAGARCDITVQCVQVAENVFKCRYVPQVPGAYLLSISWAGQHQIGQSPYKVSS